MRSSISEKVKKSNKILTHQSSLSFFSFDNIWKKSEAKGAVVYIYQGRQKNYRVLSNNFDFVIL